MASIQMRGIRKPVFAVVYDLSLISCLLPIDFYEISDMQRPATQHASAVPEAASQLAIMGVSHKSIRIKTLRDLHEPQ